VIKSAPYYWVVCDGCQVSAQEGSDYAAWAEEQMALDAGLHEDSGWWAPDGGGHYCPACARVRQPEPPL
jgi:hypothetical protein